ncbi:MAG: 50S ribosomal protein L22 [Candidatus Micrarchaeota archaeon]|nr:50S ribosomal protein L22 [Candidatus Micrarchaeota archaeon]
MGLFKYSIKVADEKKAARAQVHDVNASHKDLSQVLGAIKYKTIAQAMKILQEAITKTKAIPYKKFATRLGHRSELGGKKGRYPIKEAKVALDLLKNAVANAESKGLDKEKLIIAGECAHKQNLFMRARKYWASGIIIGYGRQSYASKYVTCWAEIALIEREPRSKKAIEGKKIGEKNSAKPETKTLHTAAVKPAVKTHVKKEAPQIVAAEEIKTKQTIEAIN